jgi:type VI secretion system secreted protein VgrG
MAVDFTQDNLYLTVSTPLGRDKLLLPHFHGEERLSGLFHFSLEMLSEDHGLDFKKIVGHSATITIEQTNSTTRYVNGIVGRFVQAERDARFTTYYAELHPWLWLLTMTSDCRIFQNQTVQDIIDTVFKDLGFTDYRFDLKATYLQREYCVQYQESAFDFVSRLLEDEGIFYFFEHQADKHTLVLADDADAHVACAGVTSVRWHPTPADDVITHCTLERQVTTGKYALDDFNFETPSTDLLVSANGTGNSTMQLYEYLGGFAKKDVGDKKANRRLEAHELLANLLRGQGYCRTFTAGHRFTLTEHDRKDINGTYVLHWVSHTATQKRYSNVFEVFPAEVPFRPPRRTPTPTIAGSQTAIVVGKKGEEIWTDKYGRVMVQFHWDQRGKNDENSGCWIRVAQGWAGKQWGSLFLPRVGQEVIVSFLEGNPDRPIITGAVYNAQHLVPYALPQEQTKSTIKSNSSKGGKGFNEIRFEDKKDQEEIYVHAQKDLTCQVLNNETNTVRQNRTVTIQEGDETLVVQKGHRTVQVNTGNETHEVKGT